MYQLIFLLFVTIATANKKIITLDDNNFARVVGVIDKQSSSKFISEVSHIIGNDIYVYIASGGGSVFEGLKIIQTIEALQQSGKNVFCIAEYAFSMAFTIFQACQHRLITRQTSMMQHQMSTILEGNLEQIKKRIDYLDRVNHVLAEEEAKRIGITKDQFLNEINNDWWLFGQDIIDRNVADDTVNVICSQTLSKTSYEENINIIFAEISIIRSGCPIIKEPLSVNIKINAYDDNTLTIGMLEHIEKIRLKLNS